jgi:acyl carrier protein
MSEHGNSCNGTVVGAQLHQQIVAIFAEIFQIDIDLQLEDIDRTEIAQWDSINHLRLVAALEEVFQIALSDEEVTSMACLRDVERVVLKRNTDPRVA